MNSSDSNRVLNAASWVLKVGLVLCALTTLFAALGLAGVVDFTYTSDVRSQHVQLRESLPDVAVKSAQVEVDVKEFETLRQILIWGIGQTYVALGAFLALLVLRIVEAMKRGETFTSANTKRLRIISNVLLLAPVISAVGSIVQLVVVNRSPIDSVASTDFSLELECILAGLLVRCIGEAFAHGNRVSSAEVPATLEASD